MGRFLKRFCLFVALFMASWAIFSPAQSKRIQEFVNIQPAIIESSAANGLVAPTLQIPEGFINGTELRVNTVDNVAEFSFIMNSDELNSVLVGDRKGRKNVIIAVYEEIPEDNGSVSQILRTSVTAKVARSRGLNNGAKRKRKQLFRVPIPLHRTESSFTIYLADPQNPKGEAFASYELPEIVGSKFIADLNGASAGIEMPDPNTELTIEEKKLVDAALNALMQPNFLAIQMVSSKENPSIVEKPHGYYLRIPSEGPSIRRRGKKIRAAELPDPVVNGTLFLGSGNISDREKFAEAPINSIFITLIEANEVVRNDEQLIRNISDGDYDRKDLLAEANIPDEVTAPVRLVYMSRKKEGFNSWDNILISGMPGPAGAPGGSFTTVVTQVVPQQIVNNTPDCGDAADNDSDGLIDFPNDPGCSSAIDNSEFNSVSVPAPPPAAPPSNVQETVTVPNTGAYIAANTNTANISGNVARTITITDNVFRNLELVVRLSAAGNLLNYEIFSMGTSGGVNVFAGNGTNGMPNQIYLMELELYLDPANNNRLTWRSFDRGAGRRAHRLDIFYSTTP